MKKLIILIIAVCFGWTIKAQQLPQVTQYMINNYAINPAIAGMDDYYQINTTVRSMWAGVEGAPKTTILSIYGKQSEHVGLGGMVYSDQAGATSRIGGNASYTYLLSLSEDVNMGLALSAGFLQYRLVKSQLEFVDLDDPSAQGGDIVRSIPDATYGMNIYAKNWYLGLSFQQLLSNNLNLLDENVALTEEAESEAKLNSHMYLIGAYKHVVNPFWSIEPSMLLKHLKTTTQFDFGAKAIWDDKLWFGTNYRNNGDISALAGYIIQDRYTIGYSYDMITSDLNSVSSGSHEFVLGIRFIPLEEDVLLK